MWAKQRVVRDMFRGMYATRVFRSEELSGVSNLHLCYAGTVHLKKILPVQRSGNCSHSAIRACTQYAAVVLWRNAVPAEPLTHGMETESLQWSCANEFHGLQPPDSINSIAP